MMKLVGKPPKLDPCIVNVYRSEKGVHVNCIGEKNNKKDIRNVHDLNKNICVPYEQYIKGWDYVGRLVEVMKVQMHR